MTPPELARFVESEPWTFAKTMPQWPHEYVVRGRVQDEESFFRCVVTIRRFGYDGRFFTKTLRYLDLDPHKYWTMGDFLAYTIIINRAELAHHARAWAPNPVALVPT